MFPICALSGSQGLTAGTSLLSSVGTYCVMQWPRDLLCNTASRYALGSKPGSNVFHSPKKELSNITSLRDLFPLHLNQMSPLRLRQAQAKSFELGLQWKPQMEDRRAVPKCFQSSLDALWK